MIQIHTQAVHLQHLSFSISFLPGRVSETSSAGETVLAPLRLLCVCVHVYLRAYKGKRKMDMATHNMSL